MSKQSSLVMVYVYLAVGSAALGTVITFVLVAAIQYFQIDFRQNLWLAVPLTLAIGLDVIFIEIYHKFKKP